MRVSGCVFGGVYVCVWVDTRQLKNLGAILRPPLTPPPPPTRQDRVSSSLDLGKWTRLASEPHGSLRFPSSCQHLGLQVCATTSGVLSGC